MTFEDLDDFLVVQPIKLPIRGTVYEFPGEIPGRTWLLLQRLIAAAQTAAKGGDTNPEALSAEVLGDQEELDLRAELMGGADKRMADDGLSSAHIQHVFRTLIVWHTAGKEAAEAAWRTLGEAPAPNRAERRAASKGSATTTPSLVSTSGTTTPPRKRAAATPGTESSAIGA